MSTLRIKRRSVDATAPTTAQAVNGELAYNESADILYYGKGGTGSASTSVVKIAGVGAYVDLSTSGQTITGTKNFTNNAITTVTCGAGSYSPYTAGNAGTLPDALNDGKFATTEFVTRKMAAAGAGTVTSVAMTVPGFLSVAGTPITTSGTLALSLVSQSANTAMIAPNGSAGVPTFRLLVAADVSDFATAFNTNLAAASIDGGTY